MKQEEGLYWTQQLQTRLDQMIRIARTLLAEADVNATLAHIMDAAMKLTASDGGSLYLVEDAETGAPASLSTQPGPTAPRVVFCFTYARNESLPFDFEASRIPIRADSINGYAALSGLTIRIADVRLISPDLPYRHDRSFDDQTGYRTGSLLTVPMKNREGEVIGVLQLINRREDGAPPSSSNAVTANQTSPSACGCASYPFTDEDEQLMTAFSGLAAAALENSRLHQKQGKLLDAQHRLTEALRKTNRELEALSGRILTAHEEERRRIARDLHDGPAQTVANLVLKTEIIGKLLERQDDAAAREQLVRLQKDIRTATADIRGILSDLKPAWLERGLFAALTEQAERFKEESGLPVTLSLEGSDAHIPSYAASAVFQVVREAMTNIRKYAHARQVDTALSIGETGLDVVIRDDGVGFSVPTTAVTHAKRKSGGGFGLEGMRERVDLLRGALAITSAPNQGTEIRLFIPLPSTNPQQCRDDADKGGIGHPPA